MGARLAPVIQQKAGRPSRFRFFANVPLDDVCDR
jgi:hypothetical protein